MQVNGFALSSQKTVFVPFHTNTSQNREVHIRVNGQVHLCIERSRVPGCTLHSLGVYEPAGRAQLPSPQRDQGAICSALGRTPPKILVNVVRALVRSRLSYGLEAMPHFSENGSCPSHRHRDARSATGPRGCRSPCRSAWCTDRPGSSRSAVISSSSVVSTVLDARLSTTPQSTR